MTKQEDFDGVGAMLNATPDKSFFYVTHGTKVVDGTVVSRSSVKQMFYSRNEMLFELHNKGGYSWIQHNGYGPDFDLFMKTTLVAVGHKNIRQERQRIEREITGQFEPLAPSMVYGVDQQDAPRTRRKTIADETLLEVQTLETPACFEPALKYKFHDGKSIIIGPSDFKTLYNNDWVNDTIIDFFVSYEVDQVVEQNKIQPSEVYAFNSFFFSKLVSNPANVPKDTIDYYQNVRRWVSKLDLFSYDNIIVPINENLHWYGCIIVGLSEFLEKKKLEAQVLANHQAKDALVRYNELSINESLRFKDRVNIFVFDSLSQKHAGIHLAFKTFLIEYCKDKYGYDMLTTDIVFRACKVPKQNNFNDCGIHVIYNIRKFLNERQKCLEIWESQANQYKEFFKASERSGMRRELIDFLLKMRGTIEREEVEDSGGASGTEGESGTDGGAVAVEGIGAGSVGATDRESGGSVSEDDIEILDTVQLDNVKVEKRSMGRRRQLYVTVGNGINRKMEGGRVEGELESVDSDVASVSSVTNEASDTPEVSEIVPEVSEVRVGAKRRRIGLPELTIVATNASTSIKRYFGLTDTEEAPLERPQQAEKLQQEQQPQEAQEAQLPAPPQALLPQSHIMALANSFQPNHLYILRNSSLHTARILKDITNFTKFLLNSLLPTERHFNQNEISLIYMFKKKVNHLRPRYAKEISEAYQQLQSEMAGDSERPRNEQFRIEPA